MDIEFYGANCIKFSHKKVTVVVDDNLSKLGANNISSKATVSIYTHKMVNDGKGGGFIIDGPGEYEVSGASVLGFSKRANMDQENETTAVVYRVILNGVAAVVLGHIFPSLTDDDLEHLGTVDILFVPVGGMGYTMDAKSAAKLARDIDAKIVVPTHYDMKGINYEVPQAPLEEFFKEIGATPEQAENLKLKAGQLPIDKTEYYQLTKQV